MSPAEAQAGGQERDSGGFVPAEAQWKTDGRIRAYLGQIPAQNVSDVPQRA